MRLQLSLLSMCVSVVAIGCNQATPSPVVQNPTDANTVMSDLVFNVEGLT